MISNKVITRLLLPGAVVVSGSAAAAASSHDKTEHICRPSELPIYTPECQASLQKTPRESTTEPGIIENYFATARHAVATITNQLQRYQRVAEDKVQLGVENADWLIKYLGEEENYGPKIGAIAVGGLTGFILALRGGKFKRFVYTSTGALAMASICFPKEAAEYSKIAMAEGKKYATIGYNFIYGVKKGDPPLELPTLPTINIPSSASEVWATIKTTFGENSSSTVTEPDAEAKVKTDPCAKKTDDDDLIIPLTAIATEVTVSDPAAVVSNLHEQCHCPVGECIHNPPNPSTLPGV